MLFMSALAFSAQSMAIHQHGDRPHNVRAQTHVHCYQHCYRHCNSQINKCNKCEKVYECDEEQSAINEEKKRALQRLRDKK